MPAILAPTSAHAQDATRYDTRMEKRADLRLKYLQAQRDAANQAKENAQYAAESEPNLRMHKATRNIYRYR